MLARLRIPLLLGLVGALLVAVGYWNIRPQSFMPGGARTTATQPEVDFFALGSHTVQFKADGSKDYVLTAARIDHIKANDVTLVDQPELFLHRSAGEPWHVRSATAEVAPGGNQVELIDRVLIQRTDPKGRPIVISTSRMTVFPDKQYAQTRQPVRIEAANGVTTATGMNADLDQGRIRLLSNVRGQHELR